MPPAASAAALAVAETDAVLIETEPVRAPRVDEEGVGRTEAAGSVTVLRTVEMIWDAVLAAVVDVTVEEVEEESTVEGESVVEEAVELDAVAGDDTIEELADDETTVLEPGLDVLVTEVTTCVTLSTLVATDETSAVERVITALLVVVAAAADALLLVCRCAPPISIDAVESWSVSLYAAPARGTTMWGVTDARWLRCRCARPRGACGFVSKRVAAAEDARASTVSGLMSMAGDWGGIVLVLTAWAGTSVFKGTDGAQTTPGWNRMEARGTRGAACQGATALCIVVVHAIASGTRDARTIRRVTQDAPFSDLSRQ